MKAKQLDKQSFETLIWEIQQTISRMDQLIKNMKNQKNNTPKESTDWNDFWKNLKERSNGKIQKPVLA